MSRFNIQTQLTVIVTVTVTTTVTLLFILALSQTGALIRSQEEISDAEVVRTIRGFMEDRLTAAELALRVVVEDPQVQEYLARGDRAALLSQLEPVFGAMDGAISRFHVHLADGTSFLRLHAPDQYGDDLTTFRETVRITDEQQRLVRGLEVGLHGLSHRVVMPIWYGGTHIGSAEFGLAFDEETLGTLQERRTGEYYLYLIEGNTSHRLSGTTTEDPCPLNHAELTSVAEGDVFVTNSCSLRDRVLVLPLKDYSGTTVAFMKVVSDRSSLASSLRSMRYQLSMSGLLAMVCVPVVVWLILGKLLNPLSQIVSQTRHIADRIADGDLDYRGKVNLSVPDFRGVIVEINRMLEALRAAGQQKQAILDGFPGMLYYVDVELNILWANHGALQVRPDMVGKNCRTDYRDSTFLACEQCILVAAIENRRIERGTAWFPKEGMEKGACWEYAAVPVLRNDNAVSNLVMIAWDITEKMMIQEKLQVLNTTLESRVSEEVRKRERQEQMVYHHAKLAAIGELAAGMAHEINQPLNTLSFALENVTSKVSRDSEFGAALREKQPKIEGSIERIRRIIDHVRVFSREQAHEFTESFSVNEAIRRALSLIETQYRSHGIRLSVRYADGQPTAEGNPYELEQVVLNLLSNARDAVRDVSMGDQPRSPLIVITVVEDDSGSAVTVEDNGFGIPRENLDRVMDPFFTTKGPKEGTGLGLSISYGLVEKMGGRLEIASSSAAGTQVKISLPGKDDAQ
ncbi:MAG: cache domain-containing protein [Alkalispirochaeta sp.]